MRATHFLTRTFPSVRTEMSLQGLAYNLKRVIQILGFQPLASRGGHLSASLLESMCEQRVLPCMARSECIGKGQGIVTLSSAYGFDETVERLKAAIMAEGDTIWFGEIDYREEAAALGVELPDLTLLLFGAPEPGGKAMAERPRMGLDAFCQKLLVHQTPGGQIEVLFNEMPALSELHYGDSGLPEKVITHRMRDTLGGAIEK